MRHHRKYNPITEKSQEFWSWYYVMLSWGYDMSEAKFYADEAYGLMPFFQFVRSSTNQQLEHFAKPEQRRNLIKYLTACVSPQGD